MNPEVLKALAAAAGATGLAIADLSAAFRTSFGGEKAERYLQEVISAALQQEQQPLVPEPTVRRAITFGRVCA